MASLTYNAKRMRASSFAITITPFRSRRARSMNFWPVRRRHRDKEVLRGQLLYLCRKQPEIAAAIDERVAAVNADVDQLDLLLQRQNYRLAFWRTAQRELGYRRFFDINTLVGLRAEDERVFADTHVLIVEWLLNGVLDGVRVD